METASLLNVGSHVESGKGELVIYQIGQDGQPEYDIQATEDARRAQEEVANFSPNLN